MVKFRKFRKNVMARQTLGYYDTIAGLSALECSHKVHLSQEQLQELCESDREARDARDETNSQSDENERREKRRAPVHGYLSKIDTSIALDTSSELQHTLLGGHVPRGQLEALSSTDFANYFHKLIDFEKATQAFNLFANQTAMASVAVVTPTPPPSTTPTTPLARTEYSEPAETVKKLKTPTNNGIKKVILCKRCKARFSGPRRFTNMKKHMCMRG
ncbi:LANO_0F07360g1_1 [Lachancea nothofagi CBS 11611]|uniref:LANO_0F07360g1_1 n=1 Tax=Lachancea nothofagi CBS 11611 TaxID=1266666 RepID=A0A1G4K8X0_9SACH|nr:LANO_0F07360g1_1 [Lachancea nothofagi CBS 11611]